MDTTRQDIADALSTVDGVTGYAVRPRAVRAGDAWPQLSQAERGPGQAWSVTWTVWVVLGGDERTATALSDELWPNIVDVLAPVAYADIVRPVSLQTEAGDMPALQIECRGE